jgi:Na+/melibiose symporter-like transporter
MLCLFNVTYTFVTVPYVSLTPELAETYHERTVLTGVKTVFLLLSMVIVSTMHAILIKSFADMKTGYMVSAGVVAIVLATAPLVVFSCTFERRRAVSTRPQLTALESVKVAVTNKLRGRAPAIAALFCFFFFFFFF